MTRADSRPIALVGLMGAGKSSVARVLGERLGAAVADLDGMVEARRGRAVAAIFAREGEAAFRLLEGEALERALASGAGVLACGGGIVLDAVRRRTLVERCRVVWLEVEPATAGARLAGTPGGRPLLPGEGAEDAAAITGALAALLERRRPLYGEVARARVSVEGRTAEQAADEVLRALGVRPA